MAAPITLDEAMADIKGSLNMTRNEENSLRHTDDTDIYSIELEHDGKYTFYINLLNGTTHEGSYRTEMELFDEYGTSVHKFSGRYLYGPGHHSRAVFDVAAGKYYLKIHRGGGKAMKYAFSIYPSLANGLVQNDDRELNDEFSMAAPVTLSETVNGIGGSLNKSRNEENSLKNSDNTDYYAINLVTSGTYSLKLDLLNGTHSNSSYRIQALIFDKTGTLVYTFGTKYLYRDNTSMKESFTIDIPGTYYLKLYRGGHEATNYHFILKAL
jgi:predicted  nucleic acid-binding Zn-ribbon protein